MGISYFRGWIRRCDPSIGPDFVMDWAIPIDDGTYLMCRDGDTGPYSPPAGCDLQTFVDSVARLSYEMMMDCLVRKMGAVRRDQKLLKRAGSS